ncbi:MAG TPA: pyridoxal-phosphate dependent enzyme, partial [Thermomicrobiales bacterium]|nr:pyridoxal-phosphate dependent enzyme [Thermomicrobiales bacterium]
MLPVTYANVVAAAGRLEGVAHRTPLLHSTTLDQRTGARVVLKAENFQRMGAFKFRGAYNALMSISDDLRPRGVIAFSSGNHAQAIALAATLLDV